MRKFSEIESINEEFLNLRKNKYSKEIVFYKGSKKLLDYYYDNLCKETYLKLHQEELDKFDFVYYKVKGITNLSTKKYKVTIVEYDNTQKPLGEGEYFIEI